MIAAMYNVSSSSPTSWAGKTALLIGTYDWQIFTFVYRKKYVKSLLTNVWILINVELVKLSTADSNKRTCTKYHHMINPYAGKTSERFFYMKYTNRLTQIANVHA